VGFVAIVRGRAIGATKPSSCVGFVPLAAGGRGVATKCTHANQHFVALTRAARTSATFLPYSQHFVARTTTATTIATNRWLPSLPTQPQLTFAQAAAATAAARNPGAGSAADGGAISR